MQFHLQFTPRVRNICILGVEYPSLIHGVLKKYTRHKKDTRRKVCVHSYYECTFWISVIGGGTGRICLYYSSRWKNKLFPSVKLSQAALIRAAFGSSNLSDLFLQKNGLLLQVVLLCY